MWKVHMNVPYPDEHPSTREIAVKVRGTDHLSMDVYTKRYFIFLLLSISVVFCINSLQLQVPFYQCWRNHFFPGVSVYEVNRTCMETVSMEVFRVGLNYITILLLQIKFDSFQTIPDKLYIWS